MFTRVARQQRDQKKLEKGGIVSSLLLVTQALSSLSDAVNRIGRRRQRIPLRKLHRVAAEILLSKFSF